MIEYDKANVTSSYPSLTKYEVATILNKAYLALIARKITGNNTRRVPFEYDTKSSEDLRPLVTTEKINTSTKGTSSNEYLFSIPKDVDKDKVLYYLEGVIDYGDSQEVVLPANHEIARKFRTTNSNLPWINKPISFLENDYIHVLIDEYKHKVVSPSFWITYISKPKEFESNNFKDQGEDNNETPVMFELSDTVAEELISLAIVFALENVESTRLQTKTSTLPLEG